MIRFLSALVALLVVLGSTSASADVENSSKKAEENVVEQKQDEVSAQTMKMPKKKTDAQIKKETGYIPKNWDKMTDKERQEFSLNVLEDRFILTTSNFQIISLASGMKICSMDVSVGNNSARTIQKMSIKYNWGKDSTYVEFSGLKPLQVGQGKISLAGSVCNNVTNGADYTATICRVEGLSEDQCRLRLFGIK